MRGITISKERIERGARIYATNQALAAALGCSVNTVTRACKRFGVESPNEQRRKAKDKAELSFVEESTFGTTPPLETEKITTSRVIREAAQHAEPVVITYEERGMLNSPEHKRAEEALRDQCWLQVRRVDKGTGETTTYRGQIVDIRTDLTQMIFRAVYQLRPWRTGPTLPPDLAPERKDAALAGALAEKRAALQPEEE